MEILTRKIGFYGIKLKKKRKKDEYVDVNELHNIFAYLDDLTEKDRVKDQSSQGSKKFHFLRKQSRNGNIQKILFSSAKYNHRPPLINKDTASRRDNPKALSEGEEERTHMVFKYMGDEIVALIEEHKYGISINAVAKYLSHYADLYYESEDLKRKWLIDVSVIPKDDFLGELKKLSRVSLGEIHAENRLLGSEFLNYSNKIIHTKNDIVISVKAEKNRTIADTIEDIYNKFTSGKTEIHKIRVGGLTDVGAKITLDTDIIKKIHHVDAEVNEINGVIRSKEFLEELVDIIKDY